ncbi:hypothetical protein IAT38_003889 [Cryptococcus sp. DSM 104549]
MVRPTASRPHFHPALTHARLFNTIGHYHLDPLDPSGSPTFLPLQRCPSPDCRAFITNCECGFIYLHATSAIGQLLESSDWIQRKEDCRTCSVVCKRCYQRKDEKDGRKRWKAYLGGGLRSCPGHAQNGDPAKREAERVDRLYKAVAIFERLLQHPADIHTIPNGQLERAEAESAGLPLPDPTEWLKSYFAEQDSQKGGKGAGQSQRSMSANASASAGGKEVSKRARMAKESGSGSGSEGDEADGQDGRVGGGSASVNSQSHNGEGSHPVMSVGRNHHWDEGRNIFHLAPQAQAPPPLPVVSTLPTLPVPVSLPVFSGWPIESPDLPIPSAPSLPGTPLQSVGSGGSAGTATATVTPTFGDLPLPSLPALPSMPLGQLAAGASGVEVPQPGQMLRRPSVPANVLTCPPPAAPPLPPTSTFGTTLSPAPATTTPGAPSPGSPQSYSAHSAGSNRSVHSANSGGETSTSAGQWNGTTDRRKKRYSSEGVDGYDRRAGGGGARGGSPIDGLARVISAPAPAIVGPAVAGSIPVGPIPAATSPTPAATAPVPVGPVSPTDQSLISSPRRTCSTSPGDPFAFLAGHRPVLVIDEIGKAAGRAGRIAGGKRRGSGDDKEEDSDYSAIVPSELQSVAPHLLAFPHDINAYLSPALPFSYANQEAAGAETDGSHDESPVQATQNAPHMPKPGVLSGGMPAGEYGVPGSMWSHEELQYWLGGPYSTRDIHNTSSDGSAPGEPGSLSPITTKTLEELALLYEREGRNVGGYEMDSLSSLFSELKCYPGFIGRHPDWQTTIYRTLFKHHPDFHGQLGVLTHPSALDKVMDLMPRLIFPDPLSIPLCYTHMITEEFISLNPVNVPPPLPVEAFPIFVPPPGRHLPYPAHVSLLWGGFSTWLGSERLEPWKAHGRWLHDVYCWLVAEVLDGGIRERITHLLFSQIDIAVRLRDLQGRWMIHTNINDTPVHIFYTRLLVAMMCLLIGTAERACVQAFRCKEWDELDKRRRTLERAGKTASLFWECVAKLLGKELEDLAWLKMTPRARREAHERLLLWDGMLEQLCMCNFHFIDYRFFDEVQPAVKRDFLQEGGRYYGLAQRVTGRQLNLQTVFDLDEIHLANAIDSREFTPKLFTISREEMPMSEDLRKWEARVGVEWLNEGPIRRGVKVEPRL